MLDYVASLFTGWMVYAGGTEGQQPGPLSDPTGAAGHLPHAPGPQARASGSSCPTS